MLKARISPILILLALAATSAFSQKPEYPASRHGGTYARVKKPCGLRSTQTIAPGVRRVR